jgi:hypothetical protein
MKSKKPQPAFIEFANLPCVPKGLRVPDGFDYDIIISSHRNIRKILDQIIRNPQQSKMSEELKYFIHNEVSYPYKIKFVLENGNLNIDLVYDVMEERIGSLLEPNWFRSMKIELLNYLRDKSENKRRLKKCPLCGQYFIANHVRSKKCDSKKCIREYWRQQKAKQRESDPETYI